ncbi:MAG: pteridine reductase [Flavobacteriales bacterium]
MPKKQLLAGKTALVTGAANRIGAQITRTLHQNGANLIIHHRDTGGADAKDNVSHTSSINAQALEAELNSLRPGSSIRYQAELSDISAIEALAQKASLAFGQLDILINNASSFYATPLGTITEQHWTDLLGSNLKAPLFLSQACYPALKKSNGCIINLLDIYATSPLKNHSLYCSAKAANQMLVKSLALDMAPEVRINGIAPGAILWPEAKLKDAHINDGSNNYDTQNKQQQSILDKIPLQKVGDPYNITQTVLFLINNDYITGEVITVDGGRLLTN